MMKFLLLLMFSCWSFVFSNAQSCNQQNDFIRLQDSILTKHHLTLQQMKFYHKSDSLNRSIELNISKVIKDRFEGIGDFIFFLDSLGNIEKTKLVNIEIRKCISSRFFDWKTFIDKSKECYDIYSDVGVDIESLNKMDVNEVSKRIMREMLIYLKDNIKFSTPLQSRIVYYSFSF